MQRHVASAFSASSNIGCNDSRNNLRFAHHLQHPVQKQGRPVPNQRSGQAERLTNTRTRRLKTPRYRGKANRLSTKGSLAGRSINSQPMRIIENGKITKFCPKNECQKF